MQFPLFLAQTAPKVHYGKVQFALWMVQFAPKVEYDILQKHVFFLKIQYFSQKCHIFFLQMSMFTPFFEEKSWEACVQQKTYSQDNHRLVQISRRRQPEVAGENPEPKCGLKSRTLMILPTQKLFLCKKKKATQSSPKHYRPILLLNSSYNILTKFLQKRIADATDQFVSDTQFGFRRGKSTSEPLFCLRRLQDPAEAGHQNIILYDFLRLGKGFWQNITPKVIWSTGTNED